MLKSVRTTSKIFWKQTFREFVPGFGNRKTYPSLLEHATLDCNLYSLKMPDSASKRCP